MMGDQITQVQPVRPGSPGKKKDEGDGGEAGTKKPGSKAPGRKRTKTGCLSEFFSSVTVWPSLGAGSTED